ncbi:hypothetical protein ABID56_002591 [Alkalibacillus flavidus]|uniref:Uncharacterized protein n=1 Tax=Alkalibacillus flavidus TaxID=546021 RepID=A0ABV2KXZ2_9BACI
MNHMNSLLLFRLKFEYFHIENEKLIGYIRFSPMYLSDFLFYTSLMHPIFHNCLSILEKLRYLVGSGAR